MRRRYLAAWLRSEIAGRGSRSLWRASNPLRDPALASAAGRGAACAEPTVNDDASLLYPR